jgi:hypothetical protein
VVEGCKLNAFGSGNGRVTDPCEYGNEHSHSIKGGGLLDYLSGYYSSMELISVGF